MGLRKTTKTLSRNKRSPEESVQKKGQETANREGRKNKELCKKRRNPGHRKANTQQKPSLDFIFLVFILYVL
jgi:hypothetical protein